MTAPASWLLAIKARIDSTELIAVTNVESETQDATPAIDDTRLQACIDDALGFFALNSGFDAQLSDKSHVAIIARGTQSYLYTYKNRVVEGMQLRELFRKECRDLRDITVAEPYSSNTGADAVSRTAENPEGRTVRIDSDRANFRRYLPGSRIGASSRYWGRE